MYAIGLALMERPGRRGVGAWFVRLGRALDHDDERQDRAWLAARAILDALDPDERARQARVAALAPPRCARCAGAELVGVCPHTGSTPDDTCH